MDVNVDIVGFLASVASVASGVIALMKALNPQPVRVDVWLHVGRPTRKKARPNRGARVKVSHGLRRAK